MKKNNQIAIDGGHIVVQSCDKERANIGVFYNGKNAYCHVSIPDFIREWRPFYYNEISKYDYDRILEEKKIIVLDLIHCLNHPVHLVVCAECKTKVDIDDTDSVYNQELDDVNFYCRKCSDDQGDGIGFAEIHGW